MEKICFGIIGGGWRSEFYLRIANELPSRFEVTGIVLRNQAKGEEVEQKWGIKTFRTIEDYLQYSTPPFAVNCVSRNAVPEITEALVKRNIPVLLETPPAPEYDQLLNLYNSFPKDAKIQVAEQYHLQPLHAARMSIVNSGKLGKVHQARVSTCHGYHGISLIRKYLNIGFECPNITTHTFTSPIMEGPNRNGPPQEEKLISSEQTIAFLDFGDKLGIYDFNREQYFSWIRSKRVLIQGDRGEINNNEVRYLGNFQTPMEFSLTRENAGEDGNLEGYYLKGIVGEGKWLYRNPYIPGRLTDDEIAIATCLEKMKSFVKTGESFYSLAEAAQDQYLALLVQESVKRGRSVQAEKQVWS